jgi:hypothetical protein
VVGLLKYCEVLKLLRKLAGIVRNKQGLYTYSDYGGTVILPPELAIGVGHGGKTIKVQGLGVQGSSSQLTR